MNKYMSESGCLHTHFHILSSLLTRKPSNGSFLGHQYSINDAGQKGLLNRLPCLPGKFSITRKNIFGAIQLICYN